jgi:hypothetical protein
MKPAAASGTGQIRPPPYLAGKTSRFPTTGLLDAASSVYAGEIF